MKFERVKEIEQYIKSLDNFETFDEVKVIVTEEINNLDHYHAYVYRNNQLVYIIYIYAKNGEIKEDEFFEEKVRLRSALIWLTEQLIEARPELDKSSASYDDFKLVSRIEHCNVDYFLEIYSEDEILFDLKKVVKDSSSDVEVRHEYKTSEPQLISRLYEVLDQFDSLEKKGNWSYGNE